MATEQDTTPRQVPQARADRGARPTLRRLTPDRAELAAYGVVWVALALLLWWRISASDGFYLDEWLYVHGAEYIWHHLPSGLIEGIPSWDRGPQRLYATLIAPVWGPLGASTAFTVSHLLNVLLLSSGVVPAALFARRAIRLPALRVLAVAVGVTVPWLMIGAHLLAENLAYPVFLWTVYAIVRAAESPSVMRQLVALAAILAGALCRLNLAAMLAVLVAAVVAAEVLDRQARRDEPVGSWLRRALRRQALVVAATVVGAVAALVLLGGASSSLGRYGVVDLDVLWARLVGDQATEARRLMVTYTRSLVVGTLILPFVLGIAVGLAGMCGRLGRRMVIPAVVGLSAFVVMIVAVSVWTFVAPEERYVFVIITPVAVLGVAALEHLDRLQRWLAGAGAFTLWVLITGLPMPALNAGNFFAAPAGAFWTRVVEHRLKTLEGDLFGWLLLAPTGWLLLAVALGALLVWTSVTRRWTRVRVGVLAAALGVCLAGQIVVLWYSSKQELYGTTTQPGGIALTRDRDADREKWIDASLPDDVVAAAVPGLTGLGVPTGYSESHTFWSKEVDAVVALPWNGSPTPLPIDHTLDVTAIDADGLAAWQGAPPAWLVTQRDDPRVQFAGRVAGRAPLTPFEARELTGAPRAEWTGQGLGTDGSLVPGGRAVFTLDRAQEPDVRRVVLEVRSADSATGVSWRVTRGGRAVARGTVHAGTVAQVRLAVPACERAPECDPASWRMAVRPAAGAAAAPSLIVYEAKLER